MAEGDARADPDGRRQAGAEPRAGPIARRDARGRHGRVRVVGGDGDVADPGPHAVVGPLVDGNARAEALGEPREMSPLAVRDASPGRRQVEDGHTEPRRAESEADLEGRSGDRLGPARADEVHGRDSPRRIRDRGDVVKAGRIRAAETRPHLRLRVAEGAPAVVRRDRVVGIGDRLQVRLRRRVPAVVDRAGPAAGRREEERLHDGAPVLHDLVRGGLHRRVRGGRLGRDAAVHLVARIRIQVGLVL